MAALGAIAVAGVVAFPGCITAAEDRRQVRGVGIAERRRGMPSVAAQATKHVIHEVIASEVGAIAGVEASNGL